MAARGQAKNKHTQPETSSAAISGYVTDDDDKHQRLLADRVRLGILSSLAVQESITFNELKELLSVSDGNLSTHARKLENAGYISCTKDYEERTPRTQYALTAEGLAALERHLKHMEALIQATART